MHPLAACARSFNFSTLRSARITLRFTPARTMATINPPRDPNTVSNYNSWRSTHVTANFDILFDQKKLVGNVVHKLKSITNSETREIILDTSHLDIGTVKVDGQPSKWELLPPLEPYGVPLKITLDQGVKLNEIIEVDVCIYPCTMDVIPPSHQCLDRRENHREMHGLAVVDTRANLEQEASLYV
jgi:leukotriene-A4 hydrolase